MAGIRGGTSCPCVMKTIGGVPDRHNVSALGASWRKLPG